MIRLSGNDTNSYTPRTTRTIQPKTGGNTQPPPSTTGTDGSIFNNNGNVIINNYSSNSGNYDNYDGGNRSEGRHGGQRSHGHRGGHRSEGGHGGHRSEGGHRSRETSPWDMPSIPGDDYFEEDYSTRRDDGYGRRDDYRKDDFCKVKKDGPRKLSENISGKNPPAMGQGVQEKPKDVGTQILDTIGNILDPAGIIGSIFKGW